jgi:acyl-CoA reductase-like NAD-dependent aldehyde dehydrogenase
MATTALPDQLSDAARDFISRDHGLLINGEWVPASDGATFETVDPATGQAISSLAQGSADDVDAAVKAARAAFADDAPWRTMTAPDRARLLTRLADLLEANADELAQIESLDNGKPVTLARAVDVNSAIGHLHEFSGWPTRTPGETHPDAVANMFAYTRREPVGVCGQIVPWNFPLLMAVWKIAPALAAGCTVVLKPAEQTPLTALRLGELALEAGIPAGVLNVVTGDGSTGQALVRHGDVNKIAFTGSTAVGREIGEVAGRALKRVTLELGGKSPNIVLPDADIEAAVTGAFSGIYFNSGQVCTAASRLMVQKDQFDDVVNALAAQAEATTPGPGLDPTTFVGPLVSAEQHERVSSYIDKGKAEAELVAGGGTSLEGHEGGYFVKPTVFTSTDDNATIVREEIFGPVLVAQPYDSIEDVARRANAGDYGLAAGIWTQDLRNAHKLAGLLRAGSIYVNTWGTVSSSLPFGGFKASGVGREHGTHGISAYLEEKSVFINMA